VDSDVASRFSLEAYLARIELGGPLSASHESLERLHLAHVTHIPFENLDIILGRPIRLDIDSLQAKLVNGRRGGYCFEQNELLATALETIGFNVTRLAARVRLGSTRISPRTHMLLTVNLDGARWIADVGFGEQTPLQPIRLEAGTISEQYAWSYRLENAGDLWVLQTLSQGQWMDLYAFTLEQHYPADYEVANHYTSTYPDSHFVRTLTAQRTTPEARYVLRGRELLVDRGDGAVGRTIDDDDELLRVLAESFGLDFPVGTRFPR
jgi:N-hydroxyarylamine O-acetyltransferase